MHTLAKCGTWDVLGTRQHAGGGRPHGPWGAPQGGPWGEPWGRPVDPGTAADAGHVDQSYTNEKGEFGACAYGACMGVVWGAECGGDGGQTCERGGAACTWYVVLLVSVENMVVLVVRAHTSIPSHPSASLDPTTPGMGAAADPKDWRGTKLMQLLKRASKRYGSNAPLGLPGDPTGDPTGSPGGGPSPRDPGSAAALADASAAAIGHAAGQLVRQAKAMQQQLQQQQGGFGDPHVGDKGGAPLDGEFGLEALLRRTEQALTLAGHEADRSRLVPVTGKLVELGGDLHAVDNEGRTALHLASGCGDKAMVLKLVELGSDVNARDSVGGMWCGVGGWGGVCVLLYIGEIREDVFVCCT